MEPMGKCPFCEEDGVDMSHVSDCANRDREADAARSVPPNTLRIIPVTGDDSAPVEIPISFGSFDDLPHPQQMKGIVYH